MSRCRWAATSACWPWRLSGELEWEKAAHGVDGRFFPWGDVPDPSWCCMRDSHPGRPLPVEVDRFPVDESPYGVRGTGGGMRDRCADAYAREGPAIVDDRVGLVDDEGVPWYRAAHLGFRLCRGPAPEHGIRTGAPTPCR